MPTASQRVLGKLRRHQYLLINAGGLIITLAVILASTLELWAGVREYLAKVQDEVSIDARQLSETTARTTASLRNNVQNIEVALKSRDRVDPALVQDYLSNGGATQVRTSPDASPVLVVSKDFSGSTREVEPFLRIAQHMSPAVSIIAARNEDQLSAYLYGTHAESLLLAVAPWPGDEWQHQLLAEKARLIAELTHAELGGATGRTPTLHWLPPQVSRLTGKLSIPIASGIRGPQGQPFGVLTVELPSEILAAQFTETTFGGNCFILNDAGQKMMSCSNAAADDLLEPARNGLDDGLGKKFRRIYQDGVFFYGWSLGQNGWTLIYTQSWRDIFQGMRTQVIYAAFTAGTIIILTWMLLGLIQRKILMPAVRQSEMVFESEHLSRTLIETAPVGLAILDAGKGSALIRSPAMVQLQSHIRQGHDVLPGELLLRYKQRPEPEQNEHFHTEMTLNTVDKGSVVLSASMSPARYHGQDVLVTAFVNVTEKKALEHELIRAREAADQANAAKSAFLAAMSHEIRTPLNAVLGNIELLSRAIPASQQSRLEVIRKSSNNLLGIISDVLDFSKIEAGELKLESLQFDVFALVADAVAVFRPVAQAKGLILRGEVGTSAVQSMWGDPTRISQVLNNLLSNAIKFTESGEVTVRAAVDSGSHLLRLEVEDSGIGMTQEQLGQLFRAFSQTDDSITRRYGGTGLGLALCRHLVEAMDGEVDVQSRPGEGSVFRVALPLGNSETASAPAFSGEKVLVLAVLPSDQRYISQVLAGWGLRVEVFQHPVQLSDESLSRADALVFWGERIGWLSSDLNRLVSESSWVIDCRSDGPSPPSVAGHVVSASGNGLKGLCHSFLHVFQGEALPEEGGHADIRQAHLHVLVAEDNAVNRRLIEEQLQLLGCTAVLVEDGQKALAALEGQRFDLLITDLAMPIMDGYELARQARRLCPQMPVIAATASVTVQEQETCSAIGIARMVAKPLSLSSLEQALCEVCGITQSGIRAEEGTESTDWLGGKALPSDVRATFVTSCHEALLSIAQAQASDDGEAILQQLHSIQGASNVFGFESIAEQGRLVSNGIRERGVKGCTRLIEQFCESLRAEVLQAPASVDSLVARLMLLSRPGAEKYDLDGINLTVQQLAVRLAER